MATLLQPCVAFATSLKSSDLEPFTSFQLLCIPGRIPSLRWTSAQWQPCRWAVLEWVSASDGNFTVAVSIGNAGSCNSQPCMLWVPIRVQVIHTARIFNTSCTWHGNPGLQAGKLQATALQPLRFFDSSFWLPRTIPGEAANASISQTCHASTFSLACIPRTPCHLLLSPSEFACEVTLKETLTFQGTPDFLRPGTGIQSLMCFGAPRSFKT